MNAWKGRAWCFGDDIDTDVMLPGRALRLPRSEAVSLAFDAVRPGWVDLVQAGDVVVGGRNFGTGSARPVAGLLREVGIRAFFAESMASLFVRNSINAGVLALSVPGVTGHIGDGQEVEVGDGELINLETGASLRLPPIPDVLSMILDAGGLISQLRRDGFLSPATVAPARADL